MTGHKYKPHHPSFYKTAWSYGLTKAIDKPGEWIEIDWARTIYSAQNRMERLRAFKAGAIAADESFPGLRELLGANEIRFKKAPWHDAFRIYISLQPVKAKMEWNFIDPLQVVTAGG